MVVEVMKRDEPVTEQATATAGNMRAAYVVSAGLLANVIPARYAAMVNPAAAFGVE